MTKYILGFLLIELFACTPSVFDQIKDPELKVVLSKVIDSAGGLSAYRDLDSLSFDKRTILYHNSDSLESDITQHIKFTFQPQLTGSIFWSDSTQNYRIEYLDNLAQKTINGIDSRENAESIKQTFLSSYFTLFIPFKLLDPGVVVSYQGNDEFSGHNAHVVKAEFNPSKHENHSTSDTWWIYFDSNTYEMLGYLVFHAPTYALVITQEKSGQSPINFDSMRETFRVDSLRNRQFLRAQFEYTNFKAFY